jgi:L-rhamnonate dehydratase
LLAGEDADAIDLLWDQMVAALLPNDRSGFAMMAVAAIDIALWDLRSRATARSLVDLLGGAKNDRLAVYVTTSQPETVVVKSRHGLKAAAPFGPEAGQEGLAANVALLNRFAEAAGPDVPVMIDAFMAWDADYALRFADAVRDLPLAWIEDPLPPNDIAGMLKLRRELDPRIALALGNFAFSAADCVELLHHGLPGILQPDVSWAGGVTETLRILKLASDAGVPVILHNTCEQPWALAIAAACQVDPIVEFVDRGPESALYSLMGSRPAIADGDVMAPAASGNTPPEIARAAFSTPTLQGT